jgi:TolA-binding protein
MRSRDRDAADRALFELAMLDIDAEEAAWDGPDPEVVAGAALARAIGNLRQLIDQVPHARRRADALYLLGTCRDGAGDDEGAISAFGKLIFEHPGSPHVAEAWFRIGEIQFDVGALDAAARAYENAAAVAGSRFATLALYKLGWTHYQAERFAEAAGAFERMLARPADSAEAIALGPEARQMLTAARRATP